MFVYFAARNEESGDFHDCKENAVIPRFLLRKALESGFEPAASSRHSNGSRRLVIGFCGRRSGEMTGPALGTATSSADILASYAIHATAAGGISCTNFVN